RLFLAVLVLLFGFNAFSQLQGSGTEQDPYLIEDVADFDYFKDMISEATQGKYFKQTADIDLGSRNLTSAIVSANFCGIYDGDSNTITYQATFTTSGQGTSYAIFGGVYGTIKNLNVNGNITVSGGGQDLRCALLCGYLNGGTIESCNVIGNVNSTADVGAIGSAGTGLIVGRCDGTIQYCTGSGNVTGPGYVGGIAGQLGGLVAFNQSGGGHVKGCSFVGSVTATPGGWTESALLDLGSFAGGICGFATNSSIIELCYVKADIVATEVTTGVGGTTPGAFESIFVGGIGRPTVINNYCEGTVNGNEIDTKKEITNSYGTVSGNYCGGGTESAEDIVENLNNAVAGDTNIHFSVVNGEVVFGRVEKVCETPINLLVEKNANSAVVTWEIAGADGTINETTWHWALTEGSSDYTGAREGTTTERRVECSGLQPGVYTFTVYTDCSEEQNGLLSNSVSTKIYMFGGLQASHCYSVENLSYSNVGVTNATISWEKNANSTSNLYQIVLNEDEPIEQSDMTITFENLQPGTTYNVEVREQCNQNGEVVWGNPQTVSFTTLSYYETATTGNFNASETWEGSRVPTGNLGVIKINEKHIVELSHTLVLKNDCQIINDGVLKIKQQGELINTTDNKVGGIVEIETPIKEKNNWTFIGAPFAGYKLECIKPAPSADISISKYDYTQGDWSNEWATVSTEMEAAEGYFAWPFYSGAVTYTTYGDVCVKNEDTKIWEEKPYDFNKEPVTELNNADTTIEKEITENNGRWMALSNPYPAKLSVNKFVAANTDIASGSEASEEGGNIQGQCIYKLTNNVSSNKQTWDVVFANTNETVKEIAMTEGFFVNLASGNSVTFSKTQLTNYPTTEAKSQVAPREFVELSLVKGKQKSKLYFAHNQEAEQNYDIFDANKLFALREVAEPYFLTDGNALVKEEVKELPYLATMNVRSFADDTVSFVVENIPEGYYVYLIDNGERIKMHEQIGYLTQIAEGENEDRFKILVTKTILEDSRAASNIEITNYNREITIESEVENLEIEVYNALGQKVFATKDYNFTLNEVPAGAYLVKAFSGKVR
ncbi:MAG: fibronectin type III domain-containing protein, partial [Bacteroidales bacterium]|nr:fibronectin type III domain-containing protein [Bacteroidales bacterium]